MSYEKEVCEKIDKKEDIPNRVNISILKYFWQASPLSASDKSGIPKFLRDIGVFKNFSDYELHLFSKYLHVRHFSSKEVIFNQEDTGVGFYFILGGQVEIWAKNYKVDQNNQLVEDDAHHTTSQLNLIATLDRKDHFGEIALLQNNSIRTASAIAKESCILLGIFKPDMNELINSHPVVASKLLQSISIILANRLSSATTEMKVMKYKLYQIEGYEHKSGYQK